MWVIGGLRKGIWPKLSPMPCTRKDHFSYMQFGASPNVWGSARHQEALFVKITWHIVRELKMSIVCRHHDKFGSPIYSGWMCLHDRWTFSRGQFCRALKTHLFSNWVRRLVTLAFSAPYKCSYLLTYLVLTYLHILTFYVRLAIRPAVLLAFVFSTICFFL